MISNCKKWQFVTTFLIVISAFLFASNAYAVPQVVTDAIAAAGNATLNAIILLIREVSTVIIGFLGGILSMMTEFLTIILSYNNYAFQEEIIIGWKIVRDMTNSFFVVVLIAIAISTIIRWKPFDFRATLPRLIVAAIIVNFSRTICLLSIQASDVLMNTFVGQIKSGVGAFLLGLRAPAYVSMSSTNLGIFSDSGSVSNIVKPPTTNANILIAQFFAIVLIAVSIAGIFFYCLILLIRVMVLWLLIILSPIAFFLWSIPGKGQDYFGQWKSEFIKQLIIGPVMAFFIYLVILFFVSNVKSNYGFGAPTHSNALLPTVISSPKFLYPYIISLVLMFLSLEVAKEIGARGTSQAAGLTKKLGKKSLSALNKASEYAGKQAYLRGLPGAGIGTRFGREQLKKSITGNLAAREEKLLEKRQDALRAKGGIYARALAGDKGAFNDDTIKESLRRNLPTFSNIASKTPVLNRFAGSDTEFARNTGEELENKLDQIENRKKATDTLWNANPRFGGMQYSQLADNALAAENGTIGGPTEVGQAGQRAQDANQFLQNATDANNRFAEYQRMQAGIAAMGGTANLTPTEQAKFNQLDQEFAGATDAPYDASAIQAADQDAKDAQANYDKMKSDAKAIDTALKKDGIDAKQGEKVGEIWARLSAQTTKDKAEGGTESRIRKELRRQKKQNADARSVATQRNAEKEREFAKENFSRGKTYSAGSLATTASDAISDKSKAGVSATLAQAATQGNLPEVLKQINDQFTPDVEGVKLIVKDLEGAGFSDQEALQLFGRLEAQLKADGQMMLTGTVTETASGKLKVSDNTDYSKVVQENIEKSLKKALTKGGKAGVMSGDKLSQAALAALNKKVGQLNLILKDEKNLQEFDRDIAKAIEREVTGLSSKALGNLQKLTR